MTATTTLILRFQDLHDEMDCKVDQEMEGRVLALKFPLRHQKIPDIKSRLLILIILGIILFLSDIQHLLVVALPRDTSHLHGAQDHYPALDDLPRDRSRLSVGTGQYPALDRLHRDTSPLTFVPGRRPVFDVQPPLSRTPEITLVLVPNVALQTTAEMLLSMSGAVPVRASHALEKWLGSFWGNGRK